MSSLPSLPPTPVPAATTVQARSVAPNDRSVAPNDRSVAPSERGVAPNDRPAPSDRSAAPDVPGVAPNSRATASGTPGAATNDSSMTSGQANTSVSFESVLEAQLGLPSGPKAASLLQPAEATLPAADGAPSDAKTEKPKPDAQGSAAGTPALPFFLPINALVTQPLTANAAGNAGDAVLSARDSQQGNGGRGEPQVPSRVATPAEAMRSEPGMPPVQAPLSGESRPASFAGTLQRLPELDEAPKHDVDLALDSQTGAPQSVAPAPLPTADRRLDVPQGLQQPNVAIPGMLGESGWGNAFSQRVVWMVGQQVQSAEFRVEPPQLGPIEVRLSIANDQASLTFVAPHAAARDAIQMSLPRLQEMLLESGVSLGNVFVGAQTPQSQHEAGARGRALPGAPADIGAITGTEPGGIDTSLPTRRLLGLVDLYA